jgi:hypothetical protein
VLARLADHQIQRLIIIVSDGPLDGPMVLAASEVTCGLVQLELDLE